MQTMLVTGGAGFIGSHLVDRLVREGIRTIVLDDLSTGFRANVNPKAEFIRGSILDDGALQTALVNVDVVLHLAARVTIRDSSRTFLQDAEVNYLGTLNVVRNLVERGVKHLVFASSMGVYGRGGRNLHEDMSNGSPQSPYGISKLAAEQCCLLLARERGFSCSVLRYFNTYGARQQPNPHVGVMNLFVHRLLRDEPITIFGDGEQERDYIHVNDVVELTLRAALERKSGMVNVGTGRATTLNELCRMLAANLHVTPRVSYLPLNPLELRQAVADISRAQQWFAFKASVELSDGIPELISHRRSLLETSA